MKPWGKRSCDEMGIRHGLKAVAGPARCAGGGHGDLLACHRCVRSRTFLCERRAHAASRQGVQLGRAPLTRLLNGGGGSCAAEIFASRCTVLLPGSVSAQHAAAGIASKSGSHSTVEAYEPISTSAVQPAKSQNSGSHDNNRCCGIGVPTMSNVARKFFISLPSLSESKWICTARESSSHLPVNAPEDRRDVRRLAVHVWSACDGGSRWFMEGRLTFRVLRSWLTRNRILRLPLTQATRNGMRTTRNSCTAPCPSSFSISSSHSCHCAELASHRHYVRPGQETLYERHTPSSNCRNIQSCSGVSKQHSSQHRCTR